MSVNIRVVNRGGKNSSSEALAAFQLKEMLEQSFDSDINGEILIGYSLTMAGQDVRDLDLLLVGSLENYKLKSYYSTGDDTSSKEDLAVRNFCYAIELKEHTIDRICLQTTHLWVNYKSTSQEKDALQQNEDQKYAFANYYRNMTRHNVYVSNFLWLKSVTSEELNNLKQGNPIGALPSTFTFEDLVQMYFIQKGEVFYDKQSGEYFISCAKNSKAFLKGMNDLMLKEKTVPTSITRFKLETINKGLLSDKIKDLPYGEKMLIFSGKAGTGKTLKLLMSALHLANESNEKRCLMLTYNHALVSDIRRLLYFTDVSDSIDDRTVSIKTLHSFFMDVMKLFDILPVSTTLIDFDSVYLDKMNELTKYLTGILKDNSLRYYKQIERCRLDWDYILIDEGQDWLPVEREIIIQLYGSEHIIVADGVDQFVRSQKKLEWDGEVRIPSKPIKQSYDFALRQKSNLISFVNAFASEAELNWSVNPNKAIPGGQIYIRKYYTGTIHKQVLALCKQANCENYDILFLAPPQMVEKDSEGVDASFKFASKFEEKGIKLFDGTNRRNRETYPTDLEQSRLFQYDSCRGLEGWCGICLNFDSLIEYKFNSYSMPSSSLGLCSEEKARHAFAYMWALMPLTRAIDTLIITIKDEDSPVGQLLKKLSEKYPDFVDWDMDKKALY